MEKPHTFRRPILSWGASLIPAPPGSASGGTATVCVIYNEFSQEFGVLRKDGIIKTYYIPDPAVHGKANNLIYFFAECRK